MKALTGGAATLYQYTTVSNRRSTRRTHCKHKPLGVLRANNVVDTSEDDPATTGELHLTAVQTSGGSGSPDATHMGQIIGPSEQVLAYN